MEPKISENFKKSDGVFRDFKNTIQGAEEQIEKTALSTGKRIGAIASNIASSTSNYVKTGREYVKENPAKGVALAAAVGALAGSLLTFTMRHRQQADPQIKQ